MGVPRMITLLRQEGRNHWSKNLRLKNSKLVIDVTDSMHFFSVTYLLKGKNTRMDRFGSSMVEFGKFFRDFFESLRKVGVEPVVVYNGGNLSEQQYGPMVSKAIYFEASANTTMYMLQKDGKRLKHYIWPQLAANVIKEVINEMNLAYQPVQSVYETYPVLAKLAERFDCPVFTSHSDFILTYVKNGFILADEFNFAERQIGNEIPCQWLYQHRLMLINYRLEQNGPALNTLYALMRPDFSGKYFNVLNKLFSLPQQLAFRADDGRFRLGRRPSRQPWLDRLKAVLRNWPKNLQTPDAVRKELANLSANDEALLNDYDALYKTFTEPLEFEQEVQALIPANTNQLFNIHQALVSRESTAPFLMDIFMGQTQFNRGCVEDTSTFRSTFSLADPVRLYLMDQARIKRLSVLDRQYNQLEYRNLVASGEARLNNPGEQMLYEIFYFPNQVGSVEQMRRFSSNLKVGLALTGNNCEQLIILELLARFGFSLAFKQSYDNPTPNSSMRGPSSPITVINNSSGGGGTGTIINKRGNNNNSTIASSSTGLNTNSVGVMDSIEAKYTEQFKRKFFEAIYNCYMYYAYKTKDTHKMLDMDKLQNDTSKILIDDTNDNSFLPKIRLAVLEIDSPKIMQQNPDISDANYIEMKHLIEMLNSSIHAYQELNSLFNYPGTRLRLTRYYDGVLIYKLLKYLILKKENSKTNLLLLEQDLIKLIYV